MGSEGDEGNEGKASDLGVSKAPVSPDGSLAPQDKK